jgi:hypothetical protein
VVGHRTVLEVNSGVAAACSLATTEESENKTKRRAAAVLDTAENFIMARLACGLKIKGYSAKDLEALSKSLQTGT